MTKEFEARQEAFMKELKPLMKKYGVEIVSLVHIVDTTEQSEKSIAVESN